jgi:hypothetical protein
MQPSIKPLSLHACCNGPAGQAAEKWRANCESLEKLSSGPKGQVDFAQLAARVNSCPFKTPSFSAACEAVPWLQKP